MYGDLKTL